VTGDGHQDLSLSGISISALGHQDPATRIRILDNRAPKDFSCPNPYPYPYP
jgi:hypothetical protein